MFGETIFLNSNCIRYLPWVASKIVGPIGSAVLTFDRHKQTDGEAKYIYIIYRFD